MSEKLQGEASFKDYLRKLQTTDPKHPDTWNPNYQDLINNDVYLKDEVEQNAQDLASLESTVGSDMQNALIALATQAMDQAGLANREIMATLETRFQSGKAYIENRGIIRGCDISKSQSATRNLNLDSGRAFLHAQIMPVHEQDNAASVPGNTADYERSCYAYLHLSGGKLAVSCTELDDDVPEGGLALYKIDVPSGNTESNDPYLEDVTLNDIRRKEPGYPGFLTSSATEYVELPKELDGTDYQVDLEVVDFEGSGFQLGHVYTENKAQNGFDVYFNGTVDSLEIRWTARKLDM